MRDPADLGSGRTGPSIGRAAFLRTSVLSAVGVALGRTPAQAATGAENLRRFMRRYRTGAYAQAGLKEARATHARLFRALGVSEIHHWPGPQGAGHIMGTCRMGDDPKTSVVDKELRVHGHSNCFVVSTAVWPTVGTANPTLTLAALSLRAVESIRRAIS
jgi:choline dehydrogenase-like flavoprotein